MKKATIDAQEFDKEFRLSYHGTNPDSCWLLAQTLHNIFDLRKDVRIPYLVGSVINSDSIQPNMSCSMSEVAQYTSAVMHRVQPYIIPSSTIYYAWFQGYFGNIPCMVVYGGEGNTPCTTIRS